jgi:hypothetical protein
MNTDLPTIVRDYLMKRFPDQVGVSVGDWIYTWESSVHGATGNLNGPTYIAQVMDTCVLPFWNNPAHRDQMIAQHDLLIKAADPKFFEVLEKFVKSHLKEQHNG